MAGVSTGFGACVCVETCLRGTARGANLTPELLMTEAETGVRVCDILDKGPDGQDFIYESRTSKIYI
jgi:hypothetical protein